MKILKHLVSFWLNEKTNHKKLEIQYQTSYFGCQTECFLQKNLGRSGVAPKKLDSPKLMRSF